MVNYAHFPPRCVNLKTISLPTCFGQERYLGSNNDYSSNMKNNQKAWWISRATAEKTPGTKADTISVKSGEGNGNPLQCSCLENLRDRGAWWAAIYGVTQSLTWLKQFSSSRLFVVFPTRSKHLWISWLQSPSAVILEPKNIYLCFHCFPIYLPWNDGTTCHNLRLLNVEL